MLRILQAETPQHIESIRSLFLEYAESLGFSLCFQSFDAEVAALPGMYAPPRGRLLLAELDGVAVGCVGLHDLDDATGEIKRLYVKPTARGHRIGEKLLEQVLSEAKDIGYQRVRLDTIADRMQTAVALYRRRGFQEIAPYRPNPISGALYMELPL